MSRHRRMLLVLAALVGAVGLACRTPKGAGPPAAATSGAAGIAPFGAWGGEGIALEITSDGARVEFDCAHGTLDHAIEPDRKGCFDLPGTYIEEMRGPVRETPAPGYAVRYAGCVENDVLKLTVTRSSDGEVLGTYALTAGREPSLVKCR
jgi:hypothetical protein